MPSPLCPECVCYCFVLVMISVENAIIFGATIEFYIVCLHKFCTHMQRESEKERERELKKSWCVYGRVKLFEPVGFLPKIDSLQAARLVIIDQEGESGKQHIHITHGDCLLTTEHQNGNANWWLPPFCVVRNLEGH